MMQVVDGKFTDFRWKSGAWDLESDAFKKDGKTNWDLVGLLCNTQFFFLAIEQKHKGPVSKVGTLEGAHLLSGCHQ